MTVVPDSNITATKNAIMVMHKVKSYASFVAVFLFLLTISAGMNSCEKETISFDSNFITPSGTNLILVDTATVQLSTVYVDSFATSGSGYIFAGNYNDPQFGQINAETYMQVGIPPHLTLPVGATFDSLEVVLKPKNIYYGDTTAPYTIGVHQLSDPLTFIPNQFAFFNIDTWDYDPTLLGSTQLIVRPSLIDTIAVRLSQSLGQDLFNKILNDSDEIQSNPQFLEYFRGLAFTGSAGNNMVMGFSDSITLRLHYENPGVITEPAMLEFTITNPNFQFNHITANRSGTPLAQLSASDSILPSSQTGNAAFSQYITGVVTKIQFPYIRNLLNLPNFVKIISAQLVVKPLANTYSSFYLLPPALRLSTTDQYNQVGPYLSPSFSSSLASASSFGILQLDNTYGASTQYTYDITSYIQQQIAISLNNQNGLLLVPSSPTLSFNRIVLDNSKNPKSQTQLIVYYASVQ